jgi:hypothetical protein
LLIGYQDIQDVLDGNKGNAKITLAEGIEVNYSALETVQGINQSIIASKKELIAGENSAKEAQTDLKRSDTDSGVSNKTLAAMTLGFKYGVETADALLDDGFMDKTEAITAAGKVLERYATSGLGPTMIDHYSVRFVFDEIGQAFFDGREIMSDIPAGFALFMGNGLKGELNDTYHEMGNGNSIMRLSYFSIEGNGNDKYVRSYEPYGTDPDDPFSKATYEVVLDISGKVVTDSVNRGTFNFAQGIAHFTLDMAPYYKWGNDPIDRLTTNILNRVTGLYLGPTPKGIFK